MTTYLLLHTGMFFSQLAYSVCSRDTVYICVLINCKL